MESPTDGPKNGLRVFAGGIAGLVVMGVLYVGLISFVRNVPFYSPPNSDASRQASMTILSIPSLFLIPMIGGIVAAYIWKGVKMGAMGLVLHPLWMVVLGICGAMLVLHEGIVCVIVFFPLFWFSTVAGAAMGRAFFKRNDSNLKLTVFPLLFVVVVAELETRNYKQEVVVDRMLIHAPPAKVWPHVLAFPEIKEAPDYWLFRVGLPYPMETTNTGNFVGAGRRCIFSSGVVIKEVVADYVPEQRLTFDITEQPPQPEAYGHITLHRGQFELMDNHDGTTTLVGSSWYTLHMTPEFYFNWWVEDMTHAVHLRVMRHVRELSEQGEQSG